MGSESENTLVWKALTMSPVDLAQLQQELAEEKALARQYLQTIQAREKEQDEALMRVKALQQELADARQSIENVRAWGQEFESRWRETQQWKWPMLMFSLHQQVRAWRKDTTGDPGAAASCGWWPARIVGCETRQLSFGGPFHLLYEVELEGSDKTVMLPAWEIMAIQSAQVQAQ